MDVYFNNPTTIPTVHMRESLDRKQSKNKAATCSFKEAIMDSTVLSSLANFKRVPATNSGYSMPSPVVNVSQENMDTSWDGGKSGVQSNLFWGTVFDDPSFSTRKPTLEEQARDLQWDKDVRPTKVGNAVMAGMIRLIPNQLPSWIGIPPKPQDSLKSLSHREY